MLLIAGCIGEGPEVSPNQTFRLKSGQLVREFSDDHACLAECDICFSFNGSAFIIDAYGDRLCADQDWDVDRVIYNRYKAPPEKIECTEGILYVFCDISDDVKNTRIYTATYSTPCEFRTCREIKEITSKR